MTISTIYKDYLQQKIIKEFLTNGVIPTKPDIDAELARRTSKNPGLDMPFTQPEVYEIADTEKSSALKANTTFQTVYDDLSVLYKAMVDQASSVTNTYDSVLSELNLIKKRVGELEGVASNLLFLAPESEGGLDFVSDNFKDKQKVDEIHTTALVDNSTTHVTLAPKSQSRISLALSPSDVQFNVITRDEFLADSLAPNSTLLSAFSDLDSIWSHRVEMRRGVGSVTVELLLRMPAAGSEVTKILIHPGASDEGNISTVSVQYSNDGLNWFEPDGQISGRMNKEVSLLFSPTTASYWKFIFNKAGYDEYSASKYIYEFGAKGIEFFGIEYSGEENELSSSLYSNALQLNGGKTFNKASLNVCEVLPKGTNISYFISALTASQVADYEAGTLLTEDLVCTPIDPLDRSDRRNQTVIDFSRVDGEIGHLSSYSVNDLIDFRYKNRTNLLLDYTIPVSVVKDKIKVLRNVGDNTTSNSSPVPIQVNEVDAGWNFNGRSYSTEFYISEDGGKIIDLGDTFAIVDGNSSTGKIRLSQGYHKFSTVKENWRNINPTSITTTDNPDILYPYNHKYLIEGISSQLYGDDLTVTVSGVSKKDIIDPNGVYTGATRYWGKTMESIIAFDYVQNVESDNFNVFSILKDASGNDRIAVKHNDQPGLMADEKFAIITRSVNGELFQAVILKATLSSQNSKLTPILDEYIIKLGI